MSSPLTFLEFFATMDELVSPYNEQRVFAVACSCGGDSLCLAYFLDAWCRIHHYDLTILYFHHGVIGEDHEMEFVRSFAMRLGRKFVPFWGEKVKKGCMYETYRQRRYEAFGAWCAQEGVPFLCVGHQRDDRIETFFMNLGRGAGLKGLCSLRKSSTDFFYRAGIYLLRPLMNVGKVQIQETLKSCKLDWLDDISNRDHRFFRARVRNALPIFLAMTQIKTEAIEKSLKVLSLSQDFLEAHIKKWIQENIYRSHWGFLSFRKDCFCHLDKEEQYSVLTHLIAVDFGRGYVPRGHKTERVLKKLNCGESCVVAGLRLIVRHEKIYMLREEAECRETIALEPDKVMMWDRRFCIRLKGDRFASGYEVKEGGMNQGKELRLPVHLEGVLPCLWKNGVCLGFLVPEETGYHKFKEDIVVENVWFTK